MSAEGSSNNAPFGSGGSEMEHEDSNVSPHTPVTNLTSPPQRRAIELPASPIEVAQLLPGATPPSTYTEPLFGSSSAIGLTAVGNTLLSSQMDTQASRRMLGHQEPGVLHLEQMISDSDAGLTVATASNRTNVGSRPTVGRDLDQLSVAASHPHRPAVDNTHLPGSEGSVEGGPPNERVRVIWGTNIVISDAIGAFRSFLLNFTVAHRKMADARTIEPDAPIPTTTARDLEPLYPRLFQQIGDTEVYNLNVDCANLRSYPPTALFALQLLHYPTEMVQMMDMVVNEVFSELHPDAAEASGADPIQVRPFNTGRTVNMRELDPSDLDKLITIKGLIIRVSNIVPDMRVAFFVCSTCSHTVTVENVRGHISEPSRCPRDGCGAMHSMVLVHNRCLFSDKQYIKIQETPGTLRAIPTN
jgi:hypothetical protein